MRVRHAQQGSAALMAIMALVLFGGIGATSVAFMSTDQASRGDAVSSEQAFGLAQAGIEHAKNRLDLGNSPDVASAALGRGAYTITSDPSTGGVVSVGIVGNARKTHTVTTNFGAHCVGIDTAHAHSAGPNLSALQLVKSCLTQTTITDWSLSWAPDNGEHVTMIQVRGDKLLTLYSDPIGFGSGTIVDTADYTITNSTGVTPVNKIRFNESIPSGKTFTITLYYADGSSGSESFVDPGS